MTLKFLKAKLTAVLILCLFVSFAASGQERYERVKVYMVEKPVPVNSVKDITGFYGHRMDLNRNNFLKTFPIDEYVSFIEKRDHTDWWWGRAEQHGKWIESSYLSAIQSGDTEFEALAERMLNRIIDSQEEEGYVGATARSYRSPERPIRGMDPYELYFVLHAFITVYEETGNEKSLNAAEKLGDYFVKYFGPGKCEFWPSDLRYPENRNQYVHGVSQFAGHAVHYSWEGALLNDPMIRLYQVTGKDKYLEWGKWAIYNIDKWSGWDSFSRLDDVADGKIGIDELQPYVHSHTFHMNFLGFLRLYCVTGDTTLLRKVKGAWDDIASRQMYVTGGVSVSEHYEAGYNKPMSGSVVETCATMSWMQLTQFLLELTGDVKYADAMERLMINHVFAAQTCDGDGLRYHTAPNGDKPAGYFREPDCCVGSGYRVISLLPTFLFAYGDGGLYVNQYVPSEYNGDDFSLKLETDYPETEQINVMVTSDAKEKSTINFRIPSWCRNPQVKLNGKAVSSLKPGTYLPLTKKWKAGDRIEIVFPMELKWIEHENYAEYDAVSTPGSEVRFVEKEAEKIPVALLHGPVVYALDMVWNENLGDTPVDMFKDIVVDTKNAPKLAANMEKKFLGPAYTINAKYKNQPVTLKMLPFANVGKWYRNPDNKPDKGAPAYTYAIWLYDK